MAPTSDLVRDSRLRTRFYAGHTHHTYYVSGITARQRTVKREERWQRCGSLGSGAFGTVWLEKLVSDEAEAKQRAVKEIRKNSHRSNTIDYSRELEAIAKFSHENYERCFVRSFGWYESGESVFIAMEYFPFGDLDGYISSPLPELEVQQITFQILEGVAFMHENGFAHRDLKPTNILIKSRGPDWWVKIGDFGISKRAEEGLTALRTLNGTPGFLAPEMLVQLGLLDMDNLAVSDRYTVAVDIWSLGEITFRALTGESPFPIRRLGPYAKGKTTFPVEVLQSHNVSTDGCDFVKSLMAPLPRDRLTAKDAVAHDWLESQRPSSARSSLEIQSSEHFFQDDSTSPSQNITEASAAWSDVTSLEAPGASVFSAENNTPIEDHGKTSVTFSNPVSQAKKTIDATASTAKAQDAREKIVQASRNDATMFKAVYDYSSPHEDDLSFRQGQIITVTEQEDEDWYSGEYTDGAGAKQEGLFPRNFVEKYDPKPPPRPDRTSPHRPLHEPVVHTEPPSLKLSKIVGIPWRICVKRLWWDYIDGKVEITNTDLPASTAFMDQNAWTEILAYWVCEEALKEGGYDYTQMENERSERGRKGLETTFSIPRPLTFAEIERLVERTVEMHRTPKRRPSYYPAPVISNAPTPDKDQTTTVLHATANEFLPESSHLASLLGKSESESKAPAARAESPRPEINTITSKNPITTSDEGYRAPVISKAPTPEKDLTISAEKLYAYMSMYSLLLIDVRDRELFDKGHIYGDKIMCMEPTALEEGKSAEQLQDRLILSPDEEQNMFEQRDKYDFVVYYDESTESTTFLSRHPQNYQEVALKRLFDTLFKFSSDKPLQRPPILLMGGINAWTDLWGSTALKTSNTAARVASGHTKPPRTVLHAAGNDSLPESSEPAPLLRQAESDIASSDTPRKPLILPLFRPISAVLSSDKDEHTSKEDEPTTSLDPKIESKKPNKKQRKNYFGEYILGQTLSQDAGVKVKLANHSLTGTKYAIRRYQRKEVNKDFYLEVVIQKDLSHPNIQRFYQLVETERHIGLVLQYASGGELFDYVLNHRYLKDVAARRLFAQLVSAVGYLHLKGIVHRNLKLETIQLDRNRNLIVTCFNLAKTFDLTDKLSEDIEYNLGNREFVERSRLTQPNKDGIFRGDLMQTSCGSPCYAAPELVVSDAMYTGRKADIWSCGIILYAMLAGYLPFDDDPANPDGDNMNLLYKYIVSTPLTFPEYLTPHARDLLKRILVPDPRKRSDMVEIARHSWLSEYVHVVSFVISETANVSGDTLVRSSEYREHSGSSEYREHSAGTKERENVTPRDPKRRTVQVEYVSPSSETKRRSVQVEYVGPSPRAERRRYPPSSMQTPNRTSSDRLPNVLNKRWSAEDMKELRQKSSLPTYSKMNEMPSPRVSSPNPKLSASPGDSKDTQQLGRLGGGLRPKDSLEKLSRRSSYASDGHDDVRRDTSKDRLTRRIAQYQKAHKPQGSIEEVSVRRPYGSPAQPASTTSITPPTPHIYEPHIYEGRHMNNAIDPSLRTIQDYNLPTSSSKHGTMLDDGSKSASGKILDFFRRRGKQRSEPYDPDLRY